MIKLQPIVAFQRGLYQKIPIMLGSVSEEAYIFIFMADANPLTDLEYGGTLLGIFGLRQAAKVAVMYPPTPIIGDKRPALARLGTDLIFSCTARNVSDSFVTQSNSPVYTYLFNHSMTYDAWGPEFSFCIGHVCHGAELPFSFVRWPAALPHLAIQLIFECHRVSKILAFFK
jgi:carboxylesterase type B